VSAPLVYRHASGAGGAGSAAVTVDLGQVAGAGHSLVIGYATSAPVQSGPGSGWTLDFNPSSANVPGYWWRKDQTDGTERTFTVTHQLTGIPGVWCIWETDLLDAVTPLDDFASTTAAHPATGTATLSTGATAGTTGTTDTLCLAQHVFYTGNWSGTFATWAGQTGGFTEDEEAAVTVTGAPSTYLDAAFSSFPADGVVGPFSSTATFSTDETRNATNDTFMASLVSYRGIQEIVVPASVQVVS
jgi:hypothetical protein